MSLTWTLRLFLLELLKLRRQRLSLAVLGAPALLALVIPQTLWLSARKEDDGYLVLTSTLSLALLLASFLILIRAALAVSAERSDKTLRDLVGGPVTRSEVLLSRWLALLFELVLCVLLVAVLAFSSTAIHHSFEDIRGEAIEPLFYADELRRYTIRAILYFMPPAVALLTMGLLLSVLSATPPMAVSLSLGALIVLDILKSVVSSSSEIPLYLFNSYLPTLFDQRSFLHGVQALAEGIGDVLWIEGAPEYRLAVIVPFFTAVSFLLSSLLIFSRSEFPE